MAAMQGMLANADVDEKVIRRFIIAEAVTYADMILAALAEQPQPERSE